MPLYESMSNPTPTLPLPPQQYGDPRQTLPTIVSEISISTTNLLQRSVPFHASEQQVDNGQQKMKPVDSTLTVLVTHTNSDDDNDQDPNKNSEEDMLKANSSTCVDRMSTSSLTSPRIRGKQSLARGISYGPESKSVVLSGEDERKEFGTSEQNFLDGLIQPNLIVTVNGQAFIEELFLPPPPPADMSMLPGSKSLESEKPGRKSSISRSSTSSPKHKGGRKSPSSPTLSTSPSHSKKKIGKTDSQFSSKSGQKVEKLLQPKREKYCIPGRYIIYSLRD